MGLGAPGAGVKRMFWRRGLLLAWVGITLGLAAAAAFSRLMSSLLFGVTPFDPATYGAAATALLVAAIAATYIPARREASVDPMESLRGEEPNPLPKLPSSLAAQPRLDTRVRSWL